MVGGRLVPIFECTQRLSLRGQNAVNGELGQGDDKPKSATKPVSIETLVDIDIIRYVLLL